MSSAGRDRSGAKILHITSAHPATDTRILHKECSSLAAAGFDVSLAVAGGSDALVGGVQVIGVPKGAGRWARAVGGLSRLAGVVRRHRPAVVHFHDPELLPLGIALRLVRRTVVYDVHEWYLGSLQSRNYVPRPVARLLARSVWLLERVFVRLGGHLVAATPFIAAQFPAEQTVIVRNYPDLAEISQARIDVKRSPRTTFCYVGGLNPGRCGPELIEAISRVAAEHDIRFLMAGPLEAVDIDSAPAIEHRGVVDRHGVASILAASDVGVVLLADLPNYGDSLPTKFFEYLAAGLPVIANETAAVVRELIESERVGLVVDGGDPGSIAAAMVWMIEHPDECQAMGRRALEASRSLSWSSEAETLVTLYQRLLGTVNKLQDGEGRV